jgi:hypothetical protein
MSRLDEGIEVLEKLAAVEVTALADAIQDLALYAEFRGVPLVTQKSVLRAYRELRKATIFYRGTDHALLYEAPDGKFAKVAK